MAKKKSVVLDGQLSFDLDSRKELENYSDDFCDDSSFCREEYQLMRSYGYMISDFDSYHDFIRLLLFDRINDDKLVSERNVPLVQLMDNLLNHGDFSFDEYSYGDCYYLDISPDILTDTVLDYLARYADADYFLFAYKLGLDSKRAEKMLQKEINIYEIPTLLRYLDFYHHVDNYQRIVGSVFSEITDTHCIYDAKCMYQCLFDFLNQGNDDIANEISTYSSWKTAEELAPDRNAPCYYFNHLIKLPEYRNCTLTAYKFSNLTEFNYDVCKKIWSGSTRIDSHEFIVFYYALLTSFSLRTTLAFFNQCKKIDPLYQQDDLLANALALFLDNDACRVLGEEEVVYRYQDVCIYVFLTLNRILPEIIDSSDYWQKIYNGKVAERKKNRQKEKLQQKLEEIKRNAKKNPPKSLR